MNPPVQGARPKTAPVESTHPSLLRTQMRARRNALSLAERTQAAQAAALQLHHLLPALTTACRVAAYWAIDGECDPMPCAHAFPAAQPIYLPVLTDDPVHPMGFAPYRPETPLRRNRFNIPEPDVPHTAWCAPEQLDIVLVPLVAFDTNGNRLGMGGGFYDRSFAFCNDPVTPRTQRPLLIGVAYAFQQVSVLPRQPWDVPLDAVVTEAGLQVFSDAIGLPKTTDTPDCPSHRGTDNPDHR